MSQTISAKPFLRLVRLDNGRGDDRVGHHRNPQKDKA